MVKIETLACFATSPYSRPTLLYLPIAFIITNILSFPFVIPQSHTNFLSHYQYRLLTFHLYGVCGAKYYTLWKSYSKVGNRLVTIDGRVFG